MPNYHPYQYGTSAYKYDTYTSAAPKRQPKQRVGIVAGKGQAAQASPSHAFALKVAKATIVAVLVFAGIGFGRVSFSAATVAEALEARQVTHQLETSRSSINKLEVTQSSLSNPTRIKNEAAALGMAAAEEPVLLDLSGDVVATDANGVLSLSGSMNVIIDNENSAKAAAAAAEAAAQAAAAQAAAQAASEAAAEADLSSEQVDLDGDEA